MTATRIASLFSLSSHNPSFHAVKSSNTYRGELIDFCVPVNLHFPPPALRRLIVDNLDDILRYYPDYLDVHQQHIAELAGLDPATVVPANGSTEVITMLCQERRGPILTSVPTFGRWTDLPRELGVPFYTIERRREHGFQLEPDEVLRRAVETRAGTLVISNPNNPTGAVFTLDQIVHMAKRLEDLHTFIIDESFIDFSNVQSAAHLAARSKNVVIVKSMGKGLGWHGVRLGYAVAEPGRAHEMRSRLPYWNINGLAAFVLKNLNCYREDYELSLAKVAIDRAYMTEALARVAELTVYPSAANFVFVELPHQISGRALRDRLLARHGIMVRENSNKLGSSEQYLRLAVQHRPAVDLLVSALREELGGWTA
jgi:threonine-phosphate decarboxylase